MIEVPHRTAKEYDINDWTVNNGDDGIMGGS